MMKNLKNCVKAIYDSSKEASRCTERNIANPSYLKVQSTVSEKIKKYLQKLQFLAVLEKKWSFSEVIQDIFSEIILC